MLTPMRHLLATYGPLPHRFALQLSQRCILLLLSTSIVAVQAQSFSLAENTSAAVTISTSQPTLTANANAGSAATLISRVQQAQLLALNSPEQALPLLMALTAEAAQHDGEAYFAWLDAYSSVLQRLSRYSEAMTLTKASDISSQRFATLPNPELAQLLIEPLLVGDFADARSRLQRLQQLGDLQSLPLYWQGRAKMLEAMLYMELNASDFSVSLSAEAYKMFTSLQDKYWQLEAMEVQTLAAIWLDAGQTARDNLVLYQKLSKEFESNVHQQLAQLYSISLELQQYATDAGLALVAQLRRDYPTPTVQVAFGTAVLETLLYNQKKDYVAAERTGLAALRDFTAIDHVHNKSVLLSAVFHALSQQGKVRQAEPLLQELTKLQQRSPNNYYVKDIALQLQAELAVGKQDYKTAWQKVNERFAIKPPDMQAENNMRVARQFAMLEQQQAKVEQEKLAAQNQLKQLQIEKAEQQQQWYLLLVLLLLVAVGLLVALLWSLRQRSLYHKNRANTDELTQIGNRRFMFECGQKLFTQHHDGASMAVITFDIDYFKQINDQCGHAAGDTVLKHLVNVVQQVLRGDDLFGRIGGEEFLILLPRSQMQDAINLAERIRQAIQTQQPQMALPRPLSASFGVATSAITPQGSPSMSQPMVSAEKRGSFEALLARADNALYQAKHAGRNQVKAAL